MKILNKQEPQQIAFVESNHLSDIDFKDFKNLYKISPAKPFFFLVNNTTLASDNPFCFRCNFLQRI